jgi:hypothetical protein
LVLAQHFLHPFPSWGWWYTTGAQPKPNTLPLEREECSNIYKNVVWLLLSQYFWLVDHNH